MNSLDEPEDPGNALPPVPSPCTSVCRMNERTGWCEGCFRSIDEIIAWGTMPEAGKRRVWALLPSRRERARAIAKETK